MGELVAKLSTEWQHIINPQKDFIEWVLNRTRSEVARIPELEGIATQDAGTLIKWFADRGVHGMDPGPLGPQDLGLGAFLDLLKQFAMSGKPTAITCQDNRVHPAVDMKTGGFMLLKANVHKHPIIQIICNDDSGRPGVDNVYMTIVEEQLAGLQLLQFVQKIMAQVSTCGIDMVSDVSNVIFPMLDTVHMVDVSYLEGMYTECETDGIPVYIRKALQQVKVRMNENGIRAQVADMMVMTKMGVSFGQTYTIDCPFVLWIDRNGLSIPLYIGLFGYDAMNKPASLD